MTIALIELSQELNLFRGELRLHVGFLQSSQYTIVTSELPHPLNVRPTSAGQRFEAPRQPCNGHRVETRNITAARIGLRGTVPTRAALSRPRRCHRVPRPPTTTRSPASRNCVPDSDAAAPGQTGRHRQGCETRCRPSTGSAAPAAPSSLGFGGIGGLGGGLRLLAMECADGQSLRNIPKSG